MALTLVVVHRDQPERCARTVRAFLAQGVDLSVTVVDNASSADAVADLVALLPVDVRLVRLDRNAGFGGGANVALREWLDNNEGSDWIVIAPHDAIPGDRCVERLLDAVEGRERAGLASAEYGNGAHKPLVDPYFGGILVDGHGNPGWEDAGHPHGTLLLARRECLVEIGLFDERYFAYCEEADLGERARRAGWEVGVVWGAVVANPSLSADVAIVDYLQLRNSLLLVRSHFGRYHAFIRICFALSTLARHVLRPSTRPPVFSAAARIRALGDFVLGRFGPPPAALLRHQLTRTTVPVAADS